MTQSGIASILLSAGILSASVTPAIAWGQMGEKSPYGLLRMDELEYGVTPGDSPVRGELTSWVGGDWNRIWLKGSGNLASVQDPSAGGALELQLLYSHLILPF